jgi:DNA-directed RNA polymerase subunit L
MEETTCQNRGAVSNLKVKVVKKTDKELKIEIEGAGHGVCNLLQKNLVGEKSVDMAGYDVPHPLASTSVIYVRTKGATKPEDALRKASEKARVANDAFAKELEKALKT